MTTISLILLFGLAAVPLFAAADGAAIYKAKCAMATAKRLRRHAGGKSLKVRDLRSAEVQKQSDLELTNVIGGGKGNCSRKRSAPRRSRR